MNPKILHRLWIGPAPMPGAYVEYGELWAEMNPGWTVKLWSEEELEDLHMINRRIWDHIKTHGGGTAIALKPEVARATQLADVAAYELIYRFGGVYVNCDMEPLRPLSELPIRDGDAWACREIAHWINNGAIGGPIGHRFWRAVIEQLPIRYNAMPGQPMNVTTGPHLLTDVADRVDGLKVLDRNTFNFASYGDVALGGDASRYREAAYKAGAIALHHWAHRTAAMRSDVR